MRFAGLPLHDAVPDAKTMWRFREQLTRSGSLPKLFDRFDRLLHERGYLATGGQIVGATVIEARISPQPGGNDLSSQLARVSSMSTEIAPRSVQIAVSGAVE